MVWAGLAGLALGRSRRGPDTMVYRVQYRFVAPDGATFEGRDQIPEARFRRLTDGATLRLHVLPSAPAANPLAHGIPLNWALSTLVVVGLLGVAGGGLVWLLRALMAAERALDSGQTRLARVSATPAAGATCAGSSPRANAVPACFPSGTRKTTPRATRSC